RRPAGGACQAVLPKLPSPPGERAGRARRAGGRKRMGETKRIRAPGLKWRKLASGHSPVWVADEGDVKAGFRPKTFNLAHLADEPDQLRAQCEVLQAEMLLWRAGHRRDPLAFDGTIRSLLSIYQRHEDSPFHLLKPGSRH